MAEENKTPLWPQPYGFGQGEPAAPAAPSVPGGELAGPGDGSYGASASEGAPDNPKSAREVVERGVVNVANTRAPEHAPSPERQQRVDATAGTDRQIKTIQDWMDAEENRPETPEERRKRERREKSKRIIAAVSDGISALGNLYFTSQYAPNMYDHEKGSMTDAVDARLERLKAERERKRDRYLNFSLKLGDLENQRAATLRELEAQQERQKLAREKAEREAEAHGWLAALQPDKQREQAGKADKAEHDALSSWYVAQNKPKELELKNATERNKADAYRAAAINSIASANEHNRGNQNEFYAWDEYGKMHTFGKKSSADAFAKQHGTWQEEDVSETTNTETRRTPNSNPQSRTSTKTKKSGYPARPKKATNVKWK